MPLRKGSRESILRSNIKTLVDDWKKDGSIGASHPSTKKKGDRADRCHRIGQGWQEPKYAVAEAKSHLSRVSFRPGKSAPGAQRHGQRKDQPPSHELHGVLVTPYCTRCGEFHRLFGLARRPEVVHAAENRPRNETGRPRLPRRGHRHAAGLRAFGQSRVTCRSARMRLVSFPHQRPEGYMNLDKRFLIFGLGFAVAGLSLGIHMAASKNHGQFVTHAHIMLIGFLLSFVYGIIHRLWLQRPSRVIANIQFVLHQAAAVTVSIGLFLLYGNIISVHTFDPILGIATFGVLLAMVLMLYMVIRSGTGTATA